MCIKILSCISTTNVKCGKPTPTKMDSQFLRWTEWVGFPAISREYTLLEQILSHRKVSPLPTTG
jgi:hypothetical protein